MGALMLPGSLNAKSEVRFRFSMEVKNGENLVLPIQIPGNGARHGNILYTICSQSQYK